MGAAVTPEESGPRRRGMTVPSRRFFRRGVPDFSSVTSTSGAGTTTTVSQVQNSALTWDKPHEAWEIYNPDQNDRANLAASSTMGTRAEAKVSTAGGESRVTMGTMMGTKFDGAPDPGEVRFTHSSGALGIRAFIVPSISIRGPPSSVTVPPEERAELGNLTHPATVREPLASRGVRFGSSEGDTRNGTSASPPGPHGGRQSRPSTRVSAAAMSAAGVGAVQKGSAVAAAAVPTRKMGSERVPQVERRSMAVRVAAFLALMPLSKLKIVIGENSGCLHPTTPLDRSSI